MITGKTIKAVSVSLRENQHFMYLQPAPAAGSTTVTG